MAVAGSAVPAARVAPMPDGTLRVEPSVMVHGDVAVGVDDALDALWAGERVYLRLYGGNLDALRRRWEAEMNVTEVPFDIGISDA